MIMARGVKKHQNNLNAVFKAMASHCCTFYVICCLYYLATVHTTC